VHSRRELQAAWAVHLLTASGVIVGILGLNAVIEGHVRSAILWLIAAMIVDGLDGPVARALDVRNRLPQCDGNALDLMVDYFTCVIVPVAFIDRFNVLPDHTVGITGVIILFTSVLWMARSDIDTDDGWFRGFPAEWSLIVPTLYLLETSPWVNLVICLVVAGFTLSRVEFPHPVRSREHRRVTLVMLGLWLGSMAILAAMLPDENRALQGVLLLAPMWTVWQVADRAHRRRIATTGLQPS
jgi:phosphatidylcholine synthase